MFFFNGVFYKNILYTEYQNVTEPCFKVNEILVDKLLNSCRFF